MGQLVGCASDLKRKERTALHHFKRNAFTFKQLYLSGGLEQFLMESNVY